MHNAILIILRPRVIFIKLITIHNIYSKRTLYSVVIYTICIESKSKDIAK